MAVEPDDFGLERERGPYRDSLLYLLTMCTRPLAAMATAVAVVSVATPGRAQTTSVDLRIDCPQLLAEGGALLEARARADLVSESLPEGNVTIACDAARALVSWQPRGEPRSERAIELDAAAAGAVDSILRGLHDLLTEWERSRAPAPVAPGPAPIAIPPTPDLPAPDAGASRGNVAASIGGDGELWSGHVVVAVGGHGGVRILLGARWHATILAGVLRTVGSAEGANAWGLRAIARVDYTLVEHLELGVGANGRILWANADGGSLTGTTAGATAAVRYGVPVGAAEVAVGGAIDALLRPLVVDVAGQEAFRVPVGRGWAVRRGELPVNREPPHSSVRVHA
jgi:hypothetical protein